MPSPVTSSHCTPFTAAAARSGSAPAAGRCRSAARPGRAVPQTTRGGRGGLGQLARAAGVAVGPAWRQRLISVVQRRRAGQRRAPRGPAAAARSSAAGAARALGQPITATATATTTTSTPAVPSDHQGRGPVWVGHPPTTTMVEVDHRTGQCPGDAVDVLYLGHDELAELVDVVGFGADDHVVGAGDILRRGDAGDARRSRRDRGRLADLGLDEDVCVDHGAPLRLDRSVGVGTSQNVPAVTQET